MNSTILGYTTKTLIFVGVLLLIIFINALYNCYNLQNNLQEGMDTNDSTMSTKTKTDVPKTMPDISSVKAPELNITQTSSQKLRSKCISNCYASYPSNNAKPKKIKQ